MPSPQSEPFVQLSFRLLRVSCAANLKTITGEQAMRGTHKIFLCFLLPILVVAGALTYSMDPDGNITSLSLHGHVLVNVCAALS